MERSEKTCHVCGVTNPSQARFCNNCGAALTTNGRTADDNAALKKQYDPRYGENDLVEGNLNWRGGAYIFGLATLAAVIVCGGASLWATGIMTPRMIMDPTDTPTPVVENADDLQDFVANTNTPRPPTRLITVTPAPPTATPVPTEGPCERQVSANDTMIGIVSSCGHRDLDVISEVLELNGLSDASALAVGQVIQVPRPTATEDPALALTQEAGGEADAETSENSGNGNAFASVLFAQGADGLPTFTPTPIPTLPPGIQWHTVLRDETIIGIVSQYGAGVEVLSQLNPEVTFSQCEFSEAMPFGGPSCNVVLIEGMRMRVPAPTPVPTLSPTPSGDETATPNPTATFNAPSLVSPGNRALFTQGELVTLRWRGTGTLAPDEVYQVSVQNLTTGIRYETTLRETSLILPREWQEDDGERHDYQWQVHIMSGDTRTFNTETRLFTWEATGDSAEDAS